MARVSPSRPAKTLVVTSSASITRGRGREGERRKGRTTRPQRTKKTHISRERRREREGERGRETRARAHRRALRPLSPRTSRRVLEHAFGLSQSRISNENSSSNSNNNNEMTTMTRKTSFSADIFCEEGSSFAENN